MNEYKVIRTTTGRVAYQGTDKKAAKKAATGDRFALVLLNGEPCDKRTMAPKVERFFTFGELIDATRADAESKGFNPDKA